MWDNTLFEDFIREPRTGVLRNGYGTITLCEHNGRREPVLEVLSRDLQAYRERIDALGEHL
ncbi:MAG: hypothetical protein RMM08_04070 [Armatimonadota bacterium]|nr:hypothetical protein [Armatimonadota bacterium]